MCLNFFLFGHQLPKKLRIPFLYQIRLAILSAVTWNLLKTEKNCLFSGFLGWAYKFLQLCRDRCCFVK